MLSPQQSEPPTRDWLFKGHHTSDTYLTSLLVGNILLDARLLDN